MYSEDLSLLVSPKTKRSLTIHSVARFADDGEILEGTLAGDDGEFYEITNGIPRFVDRTLIEANPSWNYKWTQLDGGVGHNYRILDKSDPAYQIHDIFDRNDHGGNAYRAAKNSLALDVGCGSGQYSIKLILECGARKVVSLDLTGGVDIFRSILLSRYPELKKTILIVQASVFEAPLSDETFDFVMSLGVLMHTGDTRKALDIACKLVKPNGEINVWIYASEPLAYDVAEPGREQTMAISTLKPFLKRWKWPAFWIRYFRRVNHDTAVRTLRFLSSDRFFHLSKTKYFRWLNKFFMNVDHPDREYRMINIYDGYINNWMDTWNEQELFPILKQNSIALLGMSDWRLGFWGRKIDGFYN